MITNLQAHDVIESCREKMGLSPNPNNPLDDILLSCLLRHSAGICCPCSPSTLRSSLLESLQYLGEDEKKLSDRIEDIIERLIIIGDLLELHEVAIDDPEVRGTWLFAAPPSCIIRPSGSLFLIGIVPDNETFLPISLQSRITYEGVTRMIEPTSGENIANQLQEYGFQELQEDIWLKAPKVKSAENMLREMKNHLNSQPRSGNIEGLEILDPNQPVIYYRGRWTQPSTQSGVFVARRPQEFGAPIWGFADLQTGQSVRFLDFPLKRKRWRGCDLAWHLQMAIDYCGNNPQRYRRSFVNKSVRFDFFSPLPQWSQRRFMIFGRSVPPDRCLMSYIVPGSEVESEENFLKDNLWLRRTNDSD